jgi:hypothetical protein
LLALLLVPLGLGAQPPADLALVPPDAGGFIRIRPLDLWNSPALDEQRSVLELAAKEALQVFQKKLGFNPGDVERVTIIVPAQDKMGAVVPDGNPTAVSALFVVALEKPCDRARLIRGFMPTAIPRNAEGKSYYLDDDTWGCLHLESDRILIYGSEDALLWLFKQRARKLESGPLSEALKRAAGKGHIVTGTNSTLFMKEVEKQMPPQFLPLLKVRSVIYTLDLDRQLRVEARLEFPGADEARDGEKAAHAVVKLARQQLAGLMPLLHKRITAEQTSAGNALLAVWGLSWLRRADAELEKLPIKREENQVIASLKVESKEYLPSSALVVAGITVLGRAATTIFETLADFSPFRSEDRGLKRLYEALEAYHKDHGHYPPPAITDKEGKALFSWRVALLPYLGEKKLYEQLKLDEPWHSLHNKQLLRKMPEALKTSYSLDRDGKTNYQVFVGQGAMFESGTPRKKTDIKDKPEETLLLARVPNEHSVRWMKPADVPYVADKPLKLFVHEESLFGGARKREVDIQVLFADGSTRQLRNLSEKLLKALITRNGGEKVDLSPYPRPFQEPRPVPEPPSP